MGRRESIALRVAEKQARRARLEAELGAKQRALPFKRYGVLYADPPWRFKPYSRVTGMDRAADNHYATMTLDAIKSLDVPGIAARDSVLLLWATWPMLPQALEVMSAWGFTFKSGLPWVKPRHITGYWFWSRSELFLVGTQGRVPAPAPGTQWQGLIEAAPREHSRKPDEAYRLIEHYYPSLPRIELFARRVRAGWDQWGAEAGIAEAAE
jgi:N6-adenosine-specific RNA methylase IME4